MWLFMYLNNILRIIYCSNYCKRWIIMERKSLIIDCWLVLSSVEKVFKLSHVVIVVLTSLVMPVGIVLC